jgi:hypothetical protein
MNGTLAPSIPWSPNPHGKHMPKPSKTRKRSTVTAIAASKPYVPTAAERGSLAKLIERRHQAAPHAGAKVEVRHGRTCLSWDHPNQAVAVVLWANALGTSDLTFAATVFEQLAQVARTEAVLKENEFNGMLSLVRGLAPTDPTEALLVAQMAAVHNATMVAARRLAHVETPVQQDSASTMFNKLARTFAAQVEALKKYRLKGEQIIKVQHVTVNDGGQAIVGNVQHTPEGSLKSESQSHELVASDALGPALLGHVQANEQALPSSGREGTAGMPLSRRSSRSAERASERRLSARPLHQRGKGSAPRRGPVAP